MKKISLISCISLFTLFMFHQEAISQESAETNIFDIWVGDWKYETFDGVAKGIKLAENILQWENNYTNEAGEKGKSVAYLRLKDKDKTIETYRFYSNGYADSGLVWVDGDTWTFVYEGEEGARFKFIGTLSGNTFNYKWHKSLKGGPWEPVGEGGSMTKVQ